MQLSINMPSMEEFKNALCDEDNIREFKKGMSDAYKISDTERKDITLSTGSFFYGQNQESTSYFFGFIVGCWESFDENKRNVARFGHKQAFRIGLDNERRIIN